MASRLQQPCLRLCSLVSHYKGYVFADACIDDMNGLTLHDEQGPHEGRQNLPGERGGIRRGNISRL